MFFYEFIHPLFDILAKKSYILGVTVKFSRKGVRLSNIRNQHQDIEVDYGTPLDQEGFSPIQYLAESFYQEIQASINKP